MTFILFVPRVIHSVSKRIDLVYNWSNSVGAEKHAGGYVRFGLVWSMPRL